MLNNPPETTNITVSNNENKVGVTVTQNDITNNPKGVSITNAGTGNSFFVDANGDTGTSASISGAILLNNTDNPGIGANFYSNHAAPTAPGLVFMKYDNAAAAKPILRIDNDGTSNAILINANGNTGTSNSAGGALQIINTNNTGNGLSIYSDQAAPDTGANLVLINTTNAGWDRPMLRIIDNTTEGGAANIRIDSPNPDIELVESDQVSPAGKFEFAVQSDRLQFNGRNAADNSFETACVMERKGSTGGAKFAVGITPSTSPWATLQSGGSFAAFYRAITADRTLDISDYIINCTANSFTVTLPTAVGVEGLQYVVKNSGTGLITLATTSSQTIDGETTKTLIQYNSVTIVSDGANWIII